MNNIKNLASQLLNCGYLDIEFLDDLIEAYQLEIYIDEIKSMY
jgi:hypothetical protein